IHTGDVITSGPVIVGLNPTFTGSNASGTITNLRSTFIDSLKNDVNELYFNVHSTQVPSGLVRGQLNTKLEMVADVALSGANEVPPVTTTATGLATFRLTSDKKLYTKFVVNNVPAGDTLTASHIHTGAPGVNGPVIVPIYNTAAEFGTVKIITLAEPTFTSVKSGVVYANAHSRRHPGGIVRGQIR
ncbi:MAG: CHRD domain-containing protein, partial [Chitinophagaceae bacterium]